MQSVEIHLYILCKLFIILSWFEAFGCVYVLLNVYVGFKIFYSSVSQPFKFYEVLTYVLCFNFYVVVMPTIIFIATL